MKTKQTQAIIEGEAMPIIGYEDRYSISRDGRVYDHVKKRFLKIGSQSVSRHYLKVRLVKNGHASTLQLHRLLALAFLSNPDGLPEANHKDNNRKNFSLSNLEWCSRSGNVKHAYQNGLIKQRPGHMQRMTRRAAEVNRRYL